jgi:hypothetical protein
VGRGVFYGPTECQQICDLVSRFFFSFCFFFSGIRLSLSCPYRHRLSDFFFKKTRLFITYWLTESLATITAKSSLPYIGALLSATLDKNYTVNFWSIEKFLPILGKATKTT